MSDQTLTKLLGRLSDARERERRARQRAERATEEMNAAHDEVDAIVTALRAIGEQVPGLDRPRLAQVVQSGVKVRAEDAALTVVAVNEEITKHEVAKRVADKGIKLESSNPANALATAMARSSQFVKTGRGVFRRIPRKTRLIVPSEDQEQDDANPSNGGFWG